MEKTVHANISVDCVIFGFDMYQLTVILVERSLADPSTGKMLINDYTLAGNHAYVDEPLEHAARRVLFDLTGLHDIYLDQFFTFGDPDRLTNPKDQLFLISCGKNPEERVVSVGFISLINSADTPLIEKDRKVKWVPVKDAINMAFDHATILEKGKLALRNKLKYEPIGFELLPEKFTLSQLQRLYEAVFDKEFDKRNFRKKVNKMPYLRKLTEKQIGVAHKPATYYSFDRLVYEETRSDILTFTI